MTPALMRMWISFAAMGFMVISILLIMFSRYKINNKIVKFIIASIAYVLMILAGIIIFIIVFSGPTT